MKKIKRNIKNILKHTEKKIERRLYKLLELGIQIIKRRLYNLIEHGERERGEKNVETMKAWREKNQ
jgi:hypothetical protein